MQGAKGGGGGGGDLHCEVGGRLEILTTENGSEKYFFPPSWSRCDGGGGMGFNFGVPNNVWSFLVLFFPFAS